MKSSASGCAGSPAGVVCVALSTFFFSTDATDGVVTPGNKTTCWGVLVLTQLHGTGEKLMSLMLSKLLSQLRFYSAG